MLRIKEYDEMSIMIEHKFRKIKIIVGIFLTFVQKSPVVEYDGNNEETINFYIFYVILLQFVYHNFYYLFIFLN